MRDLMEPPTPPTMQRLLKAGWTSIVPLMPPNAERSLPLLMEWHDPSMNHSLLSPLPALSTSKVIHRKFYGKQEKTKENDQPLVDHPRPE